MANMLYTKAKEKLMQGQLNLLTDDIRVAIVSNAYIQSMTTDEFLAEVDDHILGTPMALTGRSITGGAFDGDDLNFTGIASGATTEGVVIYKHTGDPATSPLIYYADTVTGFPMLTSGGDIEVRWDNGAYKIFSL